MRIRVLLALTAALAAAPSLAAISVLGGGEARRCFEAADQGRAFAASLSICDRALGTEALSARDRAATHVNRGIVYMRARDLSAAIVDYDAALKMQPKLGEAWVNRGIALVHRGGADREAIDALTRGLDLKAERPEVAYYTRGIAHELVGDARAAYDDYTQAAALKPDWADPAEQLKRFQRVRREAQQG